MFHRIATISDRLLALVAPRTSAGATACWRESIAAANVCRTCCNVGGAVGVQCTRWVVC
ncbi:hypothetical protein [Nocardiopsis sp. NRRL B-16309]|uniref:hypothetical protein n=1 Tax=Nocardiopsis sp. NRRL B-16309 TaxID=1519494 RepID=UPI000AE81431|nr:hypothetical protein [Nocardiopsis sp. NRRL B-16309]